jgi:hypothetical protein
MGRRCSRFTHCVSVVGHFEQGRERERVKDRALSCIGSPNSLTHTHLTAPCCSSASSHGSVAASNMSAKLDPAQRYTTGTAQQAGAEVRANGSTPTQATQRRHAARGQQPQTPSPADPPTLGTADVRAEL